MRFVWLAAALLTLGASAVAASFDVEGHRGARGLEPENTMPAFARAVALGVDTLELDVAITRDGVPVVSHSPLVEGAICSAPTGQPALATGVTIHSLDWRDVQRFDCGSKPNPAFGRQAARPGAGIPRLSDVLQLARTAGVRVNVETKVTPAWEASGVTPAPSVFVTLIAAALRDAGMLNAATLQSFDPRVFPLAHQAMPGVPLAWLVSSEPPGVLHAAQALGVSVYSPDYRGLREGLVKELQAGGVRVLPWTVDDEAVMRRLIAWGVDGLITDNPDILLGVLGRAKKQP